MRMDDFQLTGTRPPSVVDSRPSSRNSNRPKSRTGYHVVGDKSNVDELLFASHHPRTENVIKFKPPWSDTPRCKSDVDKAMKVPKMRPLLWIPDDRTLVTSKSDRKSKNYNHSVDLNRYRPMKQKPSFCDESLFGPRLQEPSFEAPWAEKVKKPRPYLFCPLDYARLTREASTMSAKYSSSGTLDGRPPSRQGRRPKTASTRPMTVEPAHQPTWKP